MGETHKSSDKDQGSRIGKIETAIGVLQESQNNTKARLLGLIALLVGSGVIGGIGAKLLGG